MQRRFHCDKLRLVVKYPDIFGAYDFPRAAAAAAGDEDLISFCICKESLHRNPDKPSASSAHVDGEECMGMNAMQQPPRPWEMCDGLMGPLGLNPSLYDAGQFTFWPQSQSW